MELLLGTTTAKKTIAILNHVRLALQVTFSSELFDDKGVLLPGARAEVQDGTFLLHQQSVSKLRWPYQPIPGQKARALWSKYITQIKPTHLEWTSHSTQRQWFKFFDPSSNQTFLWNHSSSDYSVHQTTHRRRYSSSDRTQHRQSKSLPSSAIPALGTPHKFTIASHHKLSQPTPSFPTKKRTKPTVKCDVLTPLHALSVS
jgi:hypothetical protein